MKKVLLALASCALAVSVSVACSSARAQTKVEDVPPLSVPPPPPRVIEPLPSTEPQAIEPVPELPAPPPTVALKPRSATRDRPEPKPENKPETQPESTTAAVPPPQTPPVPPLRTAATVDGPGVAQEVRDTLNRATQILARIDYNQLGKDSQDTYNAVKEFIRQAQEQLKLNNTVSAKALAARAEDTAKVIGGRGP